MTEMKGCSLVSPVFALTPSIIHWEHQGALEWVPAVHSSCVQVYACVIQLFAYTTQPLYTHVHCMCLYALCQSINIVPTMCLWTKCLCYVYEVCVFCM